MTAPTPAVPSDGVAYIREKLDTARHRIVVQGMPVADIDDLLCEALDVVTGHCAPHLRVQPVAG